MERKISEYLPRSQNVLTQKSSSRYGTSPYEIFDRDPLESPKRTQVIVNVLCCPSELDSKTLFLKTQPILDLKKAGIKLEL